MTEAGHHDGRDFVVPSSSHIGTRNRCIGPLICSTSRTPNVSPWAVCFVTKYEVRNKSIAAQLSNPLYVFEVRHNTLKSYFRVPVLGSILTPNGPK